MANNTGGSPKKSSQPASNQAKPVVPPVSAPVLKARESLRKDQPPVKTAKAAFVFGKKNYQFMGLGIAFIIMGFYLMSGTTDIMSTTKIVIAPIVVLAGFAIEFYAILAKPEKAV